MKRYAARASILAASIAYASVAHAQADEDAIRAGVELRKEQRDAEALEAFRKAFAIKATPRAQAQIALAEQALGRWLEADSDIEAALTAGEDPWVVKNRGYLVDAQATIAHHLGRLEITSNAPNAEIALDGHPTGKALGVPIRVAGGAALVEVRAAGYAPLRRLIDVPPGGVARETFTLVALADLRAPAPTLPIAEVASEPAPTTTRSPIPGWIAIGASAVFLGLGIAESLDRENHVSVYNDDDVCPRGQKEARCGDERIAADRAAVVSIIGYAASGVALVTGVFLLTRGPSRATSTMVVPTFGAGNAGLDMRMRF